MSWMALHPETLQDPFPSQPARPSYPKPRDVF